MSRFERPVSDPRRLPRRLALAALLALGAATACTPNVDVKQALHVTDLSGGWRDAGVVNGANKIVPSVTFRLHKSVDTPIRPLAINIAFKRLSGQTEEDAGEKYLPSVHFNGNGIDAMTVDSDTGYTGDPPQSRADMLQNTHFQDVRVHIFAKHGSANWVEIARYDVPRRLLPH